MEILNPVSELSRPWSLFTKGKAGGSTSTMLKEVETYPPSAFPPVLLTPTWQGEDSSRGEGSGLGTEVELVRVGWVTLHRDFLYTKP